MKIVIFLFPPPFVFSTVCYTIFNSFNATTFDKKLQPTSYQHSTTNQPYTSSASKFAKNSSDREMHRSELLLLSLNQLLASKNAKIRNRRIPHCRPRDIIIIRHHSFRALRNLWALIYSWDGNLFRLMVKHVHSSQVGRPENCNLLVAHIQYIGPDSMAAKYSYSVSLH